MVKEFESEEEFWKFHKDDSVKTRVKLTINPWYYYLYTMRHFPVIRKTDSGISINTFGTAIKYRRFDAEYLTEIKEWMNFIAESGGTPYYYNYFIRNQNILTLGDDKTIPEKVLPKKKKKVFGLF